MKTISGVHVSMRPYVHADLPRVCRIEADSFQEPWDADEFRRCLNKSCNNARVAEINDRVVGFAFYELSPLSESSIEAEKTQSRRRGSNICGYELSDEEIHLKNLAVHPAFRRLGVGTAMVRELQECLLWSSGRKRLVCDVSEWNTEGHLFLKACGMRAVRVERCDGGEVYVFEYERDGKRKGARVR